MAEHLPLLVFPRARTIAPPKGNGFPPGKPHFPDHARQAERLSQQLDILLHDFSKYKANVSGVVAGLEPETVLVIEIAGSVDDFRQAVDITDGLEWLGEWDIEDVEPDDDFYEAPKIGTDFFKNKIDGITTRKQSKEIQNLLKEHGFIDDKGNIVADTIPELLLPENIEHIGEDIIRVVNSAKKAKSLKGRLFLSLGNEQGLNELLNLWRRWERGQGLPQGKTKWRDIFDQTIKIRRWGIQETLYETGMVDRWHDLLDPVNPDQEIHFQIELFYSNNEKRKRNEKMLTALLAEIGGGTLGPTPFIDMPNIAFHAVKAKLPANRVRHLMEVLNSPDGEMDIHLFTFPGVMYFRPTGQSLVALDDDTGETAEFPLKPPEMPPVVAILDGVPNLRHEALTERLLFDDPDNLSAEYQPGERRHGTSIASLIVHGDLANGQGKSLTRKVYHAAVMQPNPYRRREEYFPDEVFFEDRIERAVRRMFEGEGSTPAQAPGVKIINLSIGDPERPFIHTPSPWARLLDWLSWKYRVLFCVSAGNYSDSINVNIPNIEFIALSDEEKIMHVLKCIDLQLSQRRLLSPAESLNALTIGALHTDDSGDFEMGQRIDLLPSEGLFSPISRVGHGFRRSIKPEILFPGGRQLYQDTQLNGHYHRHETSLVAPGQMVAYDSFQQGETSKCVFTKGTSNATALATRSGARIYEVLSELQGVHGEQINDDLMGILIKALLVHSAQHPEQAKSYLALALKNGTNSRRIKEVVSRYIGYGAVDIDRVLTCTEQRATVLGCGEIRENEIHEYRFPLPLDLSEKNEWRSMVVTLAWFSPINPSHRNLREAKLELSPAGKWDAVPLALVRQDSDHNQVLRGTVQHEVLEGKNQVKAFKDGDEIRLQVICKKDATETLDQAIPYGLAVTLEVEEGVNISIYEQIRARIKPQVVIGAGRESL